MMTLRVWGFFCTIVPLLVRSITAVAISIFTCGAAWLALFSLPFVVTCRPGILTLPIGKWLVYCKASEFSCGIGVPSEVCDRDYYETIDATEAAIDFIQKYGYRRVLEKSICFKDGNCFDVVDGVVYLDDRYIFTRDIAEGDLLMSRMYLKLPRKLDHSAHDIYDTSQWKVNQTRLDFASYTTTMIEEMFTSGAVNMSRESQAQVLSIGLGAGFVNSYLHHNYPRMNITVVDIEPKIVDICLRWFDLQLDERHRAIVTDGVKFIHDAAKEGRKYDAVHIDACTTDLSSELACPIPIFITPETVAALSKILTKRGVAIFNVINLYGKIQESAKKMRKAFEKDFKFCTIKLAPYSRPNMVMTCGQEHRPPALKQRYMKFAHYPKEAEYEDVYIL